jgi:hypothetical protein
MPPPVPSPVYGSRGPSQTLRSPVYTRMPYPHTPRPQTPSPSDPFGHIHAQEQSSHMQSIKPFGDTDSVQSMNESGHYTHSQGNPPQGMIEGGEMVSPSRPSASPQGQETRQHLRDLLQRQQVKKLEQDQVSPTPTDGSPGMQTHPAWSQGMSWFKVLISKKLTKYSKVSTIGILEDWQKSGGDGNQMLRHPAGSPVQRPQHQLNQFRQPFLPPHARVPMHSQSPVTIAQPMNRPNDFRLQSPHMQSPTQQVRMEFGL